MSNRQCAFAYRASIFNTTQKNRYIVTSVTFILKVGNDPKIIYRDLQNYFDEKKPNLRETRDAVLKIRAAKSMVIDERDANSKSAGSFFKNPIVARDEFAEIEKRAEFLGIESVAHFTVNENFIKIPAAWLIEKSGFHKGFEFGRVGLSTNHTLAVVNRGGAKAKDVLAFKKEIQARVKENFGVELNPEPVFVGFTDKEI